MPARLSAAVGGVERRVPAGNDAAEQFDRTGEQQLPVVLTIGDFGEQSIQIRRGESVLEATPHHHGNGAFLDERMEEMIEKHGCLPRLT